MENNMNLQVGDRITYKYDEKIRISIIENLSDIEFMRKFANSIEILKIERPKYEVIEEISVTDKITDTELLTEEEKAFLKQICKYDNISLIYFSSDDTILFCDEDFSVICKFNFYPKNMEFKKIERNKKYTLKELGLEE